MSWKYIVKSVNTDLNMYEKLEHLHNQVQEIQNAINENDLQEYFEEFVNLDAMLEFIEDIREPFLQSQELGWEQDNR